MTAPKPVVLCILDGWGHSTDPKDNAIMNANTPNWDRIIANNPNSLLGTSGLDVGLPDGIMGNSEVGHMNIGSGRVVLQDLPQINKAIQENTLKDREALVELISKLKETGGTCHLLGMLSDGGVHAHIDHIITLSQIVAAAEVPVKIHVFTDGRDTAPQSAPGFIEKLENSIEPIELVSVATVSGRYYAMDRDNRWERVEKAYKAITSGEGNKAADSKEALALSYKAEVFDEFVIPTVIGDYAGTKDGDGILMANFRADRAREILSAILDPDFDGFERQQIKFAAAVGMVEYSQNHNKFLKTLFAPQVLTKILGEIVAEKGLNQLRIAETEKYAHVTFFFNGGREEEYQGEDRIMIPSPDVATYDLKPEMSAPELSEKLVEAINNGKYDLIVVNYANTDMVGHTGIEEAAIKAVEAVDAGLGKVEEAVMQAGGALLVTADHGNAELMVDPETGQPHTQHTLNKVPFILVSKSNDILLKDGRLCDIAPTVLELMQIDQPHEMSGASLIK